MLWPKKNSYKEFDNNKNSCCSKIPLPPHNFSNGPSLMLGGPAHMEVRLLCCRTSSNSNFIYSYHDFVFLVSTVYIHLI